MNLHYSPKILRKLYPILIAVIVLLLFLKPFTTIPAGHVGVKTLFGKVDNIELREGFHFINPLKKVYRIDCRNKELSLSDLGVPSQDQLTTNVDITVQWHIEKSRAAEAYQSTGNALQLRNVYLVPTLRSLVREAGKGIANAEDFYRDDVQAQMQDRIFIGLQPLAKQGVIVQKVLLRQFDLPKTVIEGVLAKKRQEQLAEQQKAEYERFRTEQQQKIAQAEAEKKAAAQKFEQRKLLANAKAYEINTEAQARAKAIEIEGNALVKYPNIVELRAINQWDGALPKVNLSDAGAIPFLNIQPD